MGKKQIRKNLIRIYKTTEFDWLGCRITRKNQLTYHHMFKKVYGEWKELDPKYMLNNGALLTEEAHCYLHYLEHTDREAYDKYNNLLKELNETRQPPSKEHYDKCKSFRKEMKHVRYNSSKSK